MSTKMEELEEIMQQGKQLNANSLSCNLVLFHTIVFIHPMTVTFYFLMLFFLHAKFLIVDRLLPSDWRLNSLPHTQQNESVILCCYGLAAAGNKSTTRLPLPLPGCEEN